jgi:hypothetical protein
MSTTTNPSDERAQSIHERHAAIFADSRHNTENGQTDKGESEGGQSEGGRSSGGGGGGGMTLDMAQKANKGDQEPVQSAPAAQAPTLKPSAAAPDQNDAQKDEAKDEAKQAPSRADDIHRRHAEMYGTQSRHHPDYQGSQADTHAAQSPVVNKPAEPVQASQQGEPPKAETKSDAPQNATPNQNLPNLNAIRIPDDIREWRAHKAEMAAAAKAESSTSSQNQSQNQAQTDVEVDKPRPRTMR